MKRTIVAIILILACFILQSTVFPIISFGGIVPNLMIILAASIGFMSNERFGLLMGLFCGFLMDIFFGDYFGIYTLIYMYIGYLNGKFSYVFYPEDIKLPIVLILSSDLSYGIICYIFLYLLRGRFHFGFYFTHVILPEMIYTIVVTIFLYPIILFLHNRLHKNEKGSENDFA